MVEPDGSRSGWNVIWFQGPAVECGTSESDFRARFFLDPERWLIFLELQTSYRKKPSFYFRDILTDLFQPAKIKERLKFAVKTLCKIGQMCFFPLKNVDFFQIENS